MSQQNSSSRTLSASSELQFQPLRASSSSDHNTHSWLPSPKAMQTPAHSTVHTLVAVFYFSREHICFIGDRLYFFLISGGLKSAFVATTPTHRLYTLAGTLRRRGSCRPASRHPAQQKTPPPSLPKSKTSLTTTCSLCRSHRLHFHICRHIITTTAAGRGFPEPILTAQLRPPPSPHTLETGLSLGLQLGLTNGTRVPRSH